MNCRIFPHIYNVLKLFSRKKPSNGKSNFRDFSSQMKILKFLGIQPTHRGLKILKKYLQNWYRHQQLRSMVFDQ